MLELQPSSRDGTLVVRRAELKGKVTALEQRLGNVEAQSRDALARIDQRRISISLLNFENVKINLDSLIKVGRMFSAELKAIQINLSWFAELARRIDEIRKSLRQAVDAIRKDVAQLIDIITSADQARRLAERVVAGGKTLLGWVRRALDRRPPGSFRPAMVELPPGKFMMGSPTDEDGRHDDERPQHEVSFAQSFAVGRYPVTFEEYDRFAKATVREPPSDEHWGRGRRPVINVGCEDAKAYVAWLSEQTGQPYRLLSEAEWEYACRAGTTTRYWWGDEITPENANYGRNVDKTTEVGTYAPNPWGLYDMHGNVWEWVEDCWNDSYKGAPSDGSAWTSGDCNRRVVRGGSWNDEPGYLRSANRDGYLTDDRLNDRGFRIARTLP